MGERLQVRAALRKENSSHAALDLAQNAQPSHMRNLYLPPWIFVFPTFPFNHH